MAPSILPSDRSLLTLREALVYSRARLSGHALTAAFFPRFDDLLTEWQKVYANELALADARVTASAQIDGVDELLDGFVDRFSGAVLARVKSRDHELYRFYFKNGRPSDVKRAVLGDELRLLTEWVTHLTASADAELKALGAELTKLVAAGQAAEKAWDDASQKQAAFRTLGDRKALFDKANRVRQTTFADLQQVRLGPQGVGLTNDFAGSFFLRKSEEPVTVASLRAAVADKEADLTALRDRLKHLEAIENLTAESRRHAERLEKEARLREEEEALAELKKRVDALKGELGQ